MRECLAAPVLGAVNSECNGVAMIRSIDSIQLEPPDPLVVEALRGKSQAERLAMAFDCNRTARRMMAAQFKSRFPAWSEERIQTEIARRMLGGTV